MMTDTVCFHDDVNIMLFFNAHHVSAGCVGDTHKKPDLVMRL